MRRRILLADDSVTIQKVIELTFMDEDYEVRAVSNGDEAIQALPEADPDVVIADVHMPGANGYEVCRRSKERRPGVPVLLLVGTFEPFDEAQARAAGADSFLKKPFDSQELLQRVADLLASAGPQAAPAAPAAAPLIGTETVRISALPAIPAIPSIPAMPAMPSMSEFDLAPPSPAAPEPDFSPLPEPSQPVEEWRGFELAPEPELSSPFSGGPSFTLEEEPAVDWQAASLPDGEPLFEMEEEPAPAAPAAPITVAPPAPQPPSELPSLPPLDTGDVFDFEPEPIAADSPFEALSPVETRFMDVDRLDIPEVEEPEPPIEAPALTSVEELPEPQPTARMAVPEIPAVPEMAAPAPAPLGLGRVEVAAGGGLNDADVDRIARRVVELLGDRAVRDVAWEVIPDLAEVVIRDRLRELESQAESLE
jgi:CheY-like chemotaxis protein